MQEHVYQERKGSEGDGDCVCRGETNTCTCYEGLWETGDPRNGFLKKPVRAPLVYDLSFNGQFDTDQYLFVALSSMH